ncbi:MAG TPA: hypothetical protein VIM04_03600 [Candidatus Binatia bacterium]
MTHNTIVSLDIVESEGKQYGFTDSCHDRGWYGPDEGAQTVFRCWNTWSCWVGKWRLLDIPTPFGKRGAALPA